MKIDPYILKQVSDPEKASRLFGECKQDAEARHVEEINRKVTSKQAELYQLSKDGKEIGYIAVEQNGSEFWILALAVDESFKKAADIAKDLEREARNRGLSSIMFSTVRPGLIETMLNGGFTASEIIMRKSLQ